MYSIQYSGQFKRSLKKCVKRGLEVKLLANALDLLQTTGCLPDFYGAHKLIGQYKGCWECHLSPDWLLVWQQDNELLTLIMIDTGTHSDLF